MMNKEDVTSVFEEAIKNCFDNGFGADLDDMTSDELTAELLDGNDCFEEEDRETLREIVREWQEQRAGFNVGNRTSHETLYREAARPQACAWKVNRGNPPTDGATCPVCRAGPGEPCRPSEQELERDRVWNERRRTGSCVGIIDH